MITVKFGDAEFALGSSPLDEKTLLELISAQLKYWDVSFVERPVEQVVSFESALTDQYKLVLG